MVTRIMRMALLQATLVAVTTTGVYAVAPCPQKAFQGTWDGIVFTNDIPNVPSVNTYAGSCRLIVSGVNNQYIGTVKGTCDTAAAPNVPIPVAGVMSATRTCDAAFTIDFSQGPSLSFSGSLSGTSRDFLSGTFIIPESGAVGNFSLSKMK